MATNEIFYEKETLCSCGNETSIGYNREKGI
jgi:hypothetical protein